MTKPAEYIYYFVDANTGTIMAELPLIDPHFESRLNTPGTWSGKINYTDKRFHTVDIRAVTEPCKTQVWVVRNGALVWAGWVWTRKRSSDGFTVELAGNELMSYFGRRFIGDEFAPGESLTYTNTDQFALVNDLLDLASDVPDFFYKSWLPLPHSGPMSGVLINQTYDLFQLTPMLTAFTDLSSGSTSNVAGGGSSYAGFDFAVDPFFDPTTGALSSRLNLSYPRRGRPFTRSGLVLDASSPAVLAWEYEEDGTLFANSPYTQGAGSGLTGLVIHFEGSLDHRQPWMNRVSSHSYVNDYFVLYSIAQQELATYSLILPIVPSVTIDANYPGFEFGTYQTGDSLQFQSSDEWFGTVGPDRSPGLSDIYRLIAWDLVPGNEGVDQVTLTLNTAQAAGVSG